ncbi:MAG: PDZ domain-containing protein, partial [Clostridia bacterium]|nr:PDZ domain-containing protein [Clostridia bacterium]
MRKASYLKRSVGLVAAVFLLLTWFSPMQQALRTLPERITLTQGQPGTLQLGGLTVSASPALTVTASGDESLAEAGAVTVVAHSAGTSEMLLSLFGIPLRRVEVQVDADKRLIPGGMALGVAMRTDGVLVVGLSDAAQGVCPAREAGLMPGDVITTVDGSPVTTADALTEMVNAAGARALSVGYTREGQSRLTTITPYADAATGAVRLGAWVRDSTAGVGTLSFYDPETGRYAALGHAITDGDTGAVLTVSEGQVL